MTFLLRLVVLAMVSVGLAARLAAGGGDHAVFVGLAVLFCVLAVTSFLGLTGRGTAFVQRHPLVALVDVLLVVGSLLVSGGTSGVVLLGLGSALLVGVLLPVRVSGPIAVLLVSGYLAAVLQSPGGSEASFLVLVGLPLVLVSFTAVGAAVRTSSLAEQAAVVQLVEARARAAAADERLRLARDLHDVVGKSLQGVALHAQVLPRMAGDHAGLDTQARRVADAAGEAVRSVRQVMSAMRAADPTTGLADAVEGAVRTWEHSTGRAARLQVQGAGHRASGTLVAELVATLSEALENVHRHAPGCPVEVTLDHGADRALLVVRDSGPGLDAGLAASAPARGHFGLVGMRERVEGLGGRLDLTETPGGGTTVTADVPTAPGDDDLLLAAPAGSRDDR
ncbi:sensor histidine kinase [Aquipuribacter hungaricus]|uniref:Sensor histidine kinase n=1 Tax=Aquipuribacter hungaricus TaxID=545624 RepID=A0ABV7WLD6_9MICO